MGVCGAKNSNTKNGDQPAKPLKGALKDPLKPLSDGEANPEGAEKPTHPEKVVAFAPDVMEREREKDGGDKKDPPEGEDPLNKGSEKGPQENKPDSKVETDKKGDNPEKTGEDSKIGGQPEVVKSAADKAKAIGSDLKKIATENQPHFTNIDKEKGLTNTGQTSKSSVNAQPVDPEQVKKRETALQAMKNLKQMEGRPLNARDIPIVVTEDVK